MPTLKARLALLLWIIIVTTLSLAPIDGPDIESLIDYDKIVHVIFYLVMTFLFLCSLGSQQWKHILIAIIICSLYGVLMEYLQRTTGQGRHFDYYDIIANIIGSLIGAIIYRTTI